MNFSRTKTKPAHKWLAAMVVAVIGSAGTTALAQDPLASNNGLYPTPEEWSGTYRLSNHDYPQSPVERAWLPSINEPLTPDLAEEYLWEFKAHLGETIADMINDPQSWDPKQAGWYDLVWLGQPSPLKDGSTDPNSGRDALLSTYTGQILPKETFFPPHQPAVNVQNHAVIYYNDVAAAKLGEIWENLYDPRLDNVLYPDGSIIIKVEAATATPEQWPVLERAAKWNVFRPSLADQQNGVKPLKPQVLELRALQMSIALKDSIASPETGWVFNAFVYDKDAKGDTPWDRFIPLGAQWGNDPEFANTPDGKDPDGGPLRETWVNPAAPEFTRSTLGWGERLAGPFDVATRHNVITPSGKRYEGANHLRASACMSCHSSAEFPMTTNLYPSPNKTFPLDGEPFLLFEPGSEEWAGWFQNRPGNVPNTGEGRTGITALDYNMALMFAYSAFNGAMGNDAFVLEEFDVH